MAGYRLGEVLFSRERIEQRAAEIGRQITADYAGEDVLLIGVLTGCIMWMAEVMKNIELDTSIDFMAVSSYGAATQTSGVVKIDKDLKADIEGRHVLIVEDIIDSGMTLDYLCNFLKGRGPASLKVCAMLDKPARRCVEINADYIGFTAPDAFVVGYGLDVDQRYRNLPFIAALAEE